MRDETIRKKTRTYKLFFLFFYFLIVVSMLLVGFTGSYQSDTEKTVNNLFYASSIAEDYSDCPPMQPVFPQPLDGKTHLSESVVLSVDVYDVNDDDMSVYFYNAYDDVLIDKVDTVCSGSTASICWNALQSNTTYYWYAIAEDWEGKTRSDTWSFTTNCNPEIRDNIHPIPNSSHIELTPVLNITVYDFDHDVLNVSFFNGKTNQKINTLKNVTANTAITCELPLLDYSIRFSWYVIVDDGIAQVVSDTFSFSTMNRPSSSGGSSSENPPQLNEESNIPPTARINVSSPVESNTTILINGSKSFDPDGIIVNYTWAIDNTTLLNATNASVEYVFHCTGNHTIQLTVFDDSGCSYTTIRLIQVNASPYESLLKNISSFPTKQYCNNSVNITVSCNNCTNRTRMFTYITNPINRTETYEMIPGSNGTYWFYNASYNITGLYQYYIRGINLSTSSNISSQMYTFAIGDTIKPVIFDNSEKIATTNDSFLFNVSVFDRDIISNVTVHIGNHTILPLLYNVTYNSWVGYIRQPDHLQPFSYYIVARDLFHMNLTENVTILVIDNDAPIINNISFNTTLISNTTYLTINASISDNINMSIVNISITSNNTTIDNTIKNSRNNFYNDTFMILNDGNYTCIVTAKDTSDNIVQSKQYTFSSPKQSN